MKGIFKQTAKGATIQTKDNTQFFPGAATPEECVAMLNNPNLVKTTGTVTSADGLRTTNMVYYAVQALVEVDLSKASKVKTREELLSAL